MLALLGRSGTGQPDGSIAQDARFGGGALRDHLELGVVFQAGDEEHAGIGPVGKQPVVSL
jgi:hypothetical protein